MLDNGGNLLEFNHILQTGTGGTKRTLFGVRGKGGGSITNWINSVELLMTRDRKDTTHPCCVEVLRFVDGCSVSVDGVVVA
jgi:hypothetical protein